ncbi:MAG: glutamate-cysteine ligase family protein [Gemmataceae bacterium]|nr:glutamate-cysteine ligase family protein [Gemmataceae bacterium]MDW8263793.1 glutamate-cysteine ligase family protein [Gemmataceae bacterium]
MTASDHRGFRFGLEVEFLLVEAESFRPLWHPDLSFEELDATFGAIDLRDLPSVEGLLRAPPHRTITPFVVEGYHVPDPYTPDASLLPKGVEIRTPACGSVAEAVRYLAELHRRLQAALLAHGWRAVALSHHPVEERFDGPQGKRRYDVWQWAMQAMLTYGPDVNVSLPAERAGRLATADLWAKVNYYGPAMTLFSLAAPLCRGGLWRIRGRVGKSLRTYRRSLYGQALEFHPEQPGRLEFKAFEMSNRLDDFRAYLLLWLAVLLDEGLRGRASDASRVYDLGAIARDGWAVADVRERAAELLDRAPRILAAWDFDPQPLAHWGQRLERRWLPADEIIAQYETTGSLAAVLRSRAELLEDSVEGPLP